MKLTAKDSNLYEAAVEQSWTSPAYFVALYPSQKLYLATIGSAGDSVRSV